MTEETINPDPVSDPAPPHSAPPEEGAHPRGKWADKKEFLFSMAAQMMGIGHLLHFPYMCYIHGGCVFFIPFFFFLFFLGFPLFLLETAVGQYTSQSGAAAWRKICPMFQGVGFASQVILVYLNIYHIIILVWILFYLYSSFKSPLPWSTCGNWWNTESCSTAKFNTTNMGNLYENVVEDEFWRLRVLRMSDDVPITALNWHLAVCLVIAWILCYFCVWKGIRIMGKVVYFTVPFSCLILFIFFIRGMMLPGAWEGVIFYLTPDFSRITKLDVWANAAVYAVYFHSVGTGVSTSLGSYNKYNNNCCRDCLLLVFLNVATYIFASFVVFFVLGFHAHTQGVSKERVTSPGSTLAFITFPQAVAVMPVPSFWAILFFLMMLFLSLNNQFTYIESLATTITDLLPRRLRRPHTREPLVLAITVVCFLLGLLLVTKGGEHLFRLMEFYGTDVIILFFIACFESICIAWVYGVDRFYDNIEDMIGYPPFPVLKYCWLFITPLICTVSIIYHTMRGVSAFLPGLPDVLIGVVGTLLMAIPMMCIPVFIFVALCKNSQATTTPSRDLRQSRPHMPILTLCKCVIFKAPMQSARRDGEDMKMMMEETERA